MRTTGLVYHRRAIELSHFWGFLSRSHIFAWTTWPKTLWPRGIMRPRNWKIGHDALCFPCDVNSRKILIKRAWWHTTVSLACYFTHCLLISVSVYSPFYPKSCGGSQLLLHYSKVKKSRIKKLWEVFPLENSERFCERLENEKKQTIGLGKKCEFLSHVATASNNFHLFE